jgi:hypothetical protein
MMKSAAARLNDNIEKAQTAAGKPAGEGDDPEVDTEDKKDQGKKKQSKGDNEDMKIDKSKMTQAELLILEDIEKRYGVADDPAQTEQTPEGKPAVTKSVEKLSRTRKHLQMARTSTRDSILLLRQKSKHSESSVRMLRTENLKP